MATTVFVLFCYCTNAMSTTELLNFFVVKLEKMPANKLRLCILTCSLVASLCPLFGYYHIEFSHKLVSIFPSGTETTP